MLRENLMYQAALLQRAVHAACPEVIASQSDIVPGTTMSKELALSQALTTINQSLFLWSKCEKTSAFFMGTALGLLMAHDVYIHSDEHMELLLNGSANILPA
jgi:hypothetical protein